MTLQSRPDPCATSLLSLLSPAERRDSGQWEEYSVSNTQKQRVRHRRQQWEGQK